MNNNIIQLVELPSELGAGTRGSSLGSAAMKIAALKQHNFLFKHYKSITVPTENERLLSPDRENHYAKQIDGILLTYQRLVETMQGVFDDKKFPIILSGDHSCGGATIAAIKSAYPEKTLGVIWVDAHADLHTPYTTPSGNMHGMPLGVSLGLDNLNMQRNAISPHTANLWSELKNIGNISPKIQPQNLAFVGLRSTEMEESHLLESLKIQQHTVEKLQEFGAVKIAEDILEQFNHCDLIYVSFDVDSLDCEVVSRGTGTPVKDGLLPQEAILLINTLLKSPKTCCLEITEVNPTLDNKRNLMAETAFAILQSAIQTVESR
jgi:arginase